jgi:iron(III) transport system substrate-binding protein
MKRFYQALAAWGILALAAAPLAQAQDAALVAKAKAEGTVTVYTSTDLAEAQAMVDAFQKKYPGVKVNYNDLGTTGVYNKIIAEAAAKQVTADIAWTSAMDLQMKLAAGGYFQAADLPQKKDIPAWASYKDTLYATSLEPVGIIYNKKLVPEKDVPHSRADLIKFLALPLAQGKVATFDPEKSGTGFLFSTNDILNHRDFWTLAKAFGKAHGKTYSSSGAMKETVVSGENVLAFNVIGSYALQWVTESPNLGVAFGTDYTPAFSRLALVANKAPHPNAAKLMLDFMVSKEGQAALTKGGIPSVRSDVTEGLNPKTLNERVGGNLRPIKLGEGLMEYMNPQKRVQFFRDWKAALSGS